MLTPLRSLLLGGFIVLATMLSTSGDARYENRLAVAAAASVNDHEALLSAMTYNVNALPWPIALGREAALGRIAERLAAMRRAGEQPRLVLLQEAFTADASAIARRAGYRYVADGPDASLRSPELPGAADRLFLASARWDRGERSGKRLGSGLMILSDYPIVAIDRMSFPDFACAGFDCLANKGVMLARIRVPGMAQPLMVANAHLNARKAAGVSIARTRQAYDRQVALMAAFVADRVRPGSPLLIGGDMNIGRDVGRARLFFGAFAQSGLAFVASRHGGLRQALEEAAWPDSRTQADLAHADVHGKDWLFARAADGRPMPIRAASVPFGTEPDGEPLSDHFGYMIDYALPGPAPATRFAHSAAPAQPRS